MKVIIPAAGLGTRFLPWTKACPKELLPLGNIPVVQWVIEAVLQAGINEIIIVISEGKEALVKYFSPNPSLDSFLRQKGKYDRIAPLNQLLSKLDLTFIYQKGDYGNASPVISAKNLIGAKEPFLVVWGDEIVLSEPSYITQVIGVYKNTGKPVIAAIKLPQEKLVSKGVPKLVGFKDEVGEIKEIVEKPSIKAMPSDYALTAAYLFTPDFWPHLDSLKAGKDGELWLTDAVNEYAKSKTVLARHIKGAKLYDVGTKKNYMQAWRSLCQKSPKP